MALTPQQLRAAAFVSRLRAIAAERKLRLPLAKWIDPESRSDPYTTKVLDAVLDGITYDTPFTGNRFTAQRAYYQAAVRTIMPVIADSARSWAVAALIKQADTVGRIQVVVSSTGPALAKAATDARVEARTGTFRETTADEMREITGEKAGGAGTAAERLQRVRYVSAVRKTGNKYLLQLMAHPKGVAIVDAFAESAADGQVLTAELLGDCEEAIRNTHNDLASDSALIWSFPPALVAGVGLLKPPTMTPLADFALAWAMVKKRRLAEYIDVAGNVIMALQLIGGPIGNAIGEVLDIALAVVDGAMSFADEVRQEQAGVASTFAAQSDKLSSGGSPKRALVSAAAIVVAAAAPTALSRLGKRNRRAADEYVASVETIPRATPVPPVKPGPTVPDVPGAASRGTPSEAVAAAERSAARPTQATTAEAQATSAVARGTSAEATAVPTQRPRATPEERATAPKQKELGEVSSGAVTPQVQRATNTSAAAGADTVPPRKLRQGFVDELEARLENKERERRKDLAEASKLEQEIGVLSGRMKDAYAKRDSAELAALRIRRGVAEEKLLGIRKWDEWGEIDALKNDLKGTEQDYFKKLTGNAAGRGEYLAVRNRGLDEVFGMAGALEVEHVYPRSKIFLVEGFERLSYDDKIALFNFGPNLRAMNADANGVRGARPYRTLTGPLMTRYPSQVAAMALVEAEMETMISRMIVSGPYRREQLARVARGEVPLLPNGSPITIQTLTTTAPVGKR